jgi:hypothetical protein
MNELLKKISRMCVTGKVTPILKALTDFGFDVKRDYKGCWLGIWSADDISCICESDCLMRRVVNITVYKEDTGISFIVNEFVDNSPEWIDKDFRDG